MLRKPARDPWFRWRCRTCAAPITRITAAPPTGICPGCDARDNFVLVTGPTLSPAEGPHLDHPCTIGDRSRPALNTPESVADHAEANKPNPGTLF